MQQGIRLLEYKGRPFDMRVLIISVPSYADVAGAALEIASVLDGQLGPFGELGLDLAIDEGGAIWFIEANTKPDKDLVVGLDKIDGIHSQYLSIFEYAGYLCGLKG